MNLKPYTYKNSVIIYDHDSHKGVRAKELFFLNSPHLHNQLLRLSYTVPIHHLEDFTQEERRPIINNSTEKMKIATLHEALIQIGFLEDSIFDRFRSIVTQVYNKNQIEILTDMINKVVIQGKQTRLVAKSLTNKQHTNENYFEEKYNYISQLLDGDEWEISGFDYVSEGTYCELGHEIKKVVQITSKHNNYYMQFGVQCIEDVINLNQTQKTELNNMFESYKRIVTEYTYELEAMVESNIDIDIVMREQVQALELLKYSMLFNKEQSANQFLRTNIRRELDSVSNITTQRYDYMVYLAKNNIPIPQDYFRDILDLNNEQLGLNALRRNLNTFLDNPDQVALQVYRAMFGYNTPSRLAKTESPKNLIGFPISKTVFKQHLSHTDVLKPTPKLQDMYIKVIEQGISLEELFNGIILIMNSLQNLPAPKVELENNKAIYHTRWGTQGSISLKQVITRVAKLKPNMQLTTILKIFKEFNTTFETPQSLNSVIQHVLKNYLNEKEVNLGAGYGIKTIYTMSSDLELLTHESEPKNLLPYYNIDLSFYANYINSRLSVSEIGDKLRDTYKYNPVSDRSLSVLISIQSGVIGDFDNRMAITNSLATPNDKTDLDTKAIHDLLLVKSVELTITQGIEDKELYEEIHSLIRKFEFKQLDEYNKKLEDISKTDPTISGNTSELPDKELTLNQSLAFSNNSSSLVINHIDLFTDENLTTDSPNLRLILTTNNPNITLGIETLQLIALNTLVSTGKIKLTDSEAKQTKFLLEKVAPRLISNKYVLSQNQSKYGMNQVKSILIKRYNETVKHNK